MPAVVVIAYKLNFALLKNQYYYYLLMYTLLDNCKNFRINKIFILSILLLIELTTFAQAKGYYTIVAPGLLITESKFNVAVSVYKSNEPVLIEIGLQGPEFNEKKCVELPKDTSTDVEFEVPDLQEGEYILLVRGLSGLLFRNSTGLTFARNKPLGFVEFDKPSKNYQPGDVLNFRLCVLKDNICAFGQKDNIKITLKSLHGYSIRDISIIETINGYLFGRILLPEKTTFIKSDDWYFDVKINGYNILSERLIIKKSNLHYYNVQVVAPEQLSLKDADFQVNVSSNFLHSHAVDGTARLLLNAACYSDHATMHPPKKILEQQLYNGLSVFNLNLNYFAEHMDRFKGYCDIDLSAEVEAAHTYLTERAVKKIKLYAYKYEVKNTNAYIVYYEPNKMQNLTFSIKHLNGTVLAKNKKLVTLICIQNIAYQKFPLDGPQPDEQSTAQARTTKLKKLKFFAYLNEAGNCSFQVMLPELVALKGYSNHFIMQILFDREEYNIKGAIHKNFDNYDDYEVETTQFSKKEVLKIIALCNPIIVGETCSFSVNSSVPLSFLVSVIIVHDKIFSSERYEFNDQLKSFNFTIKITTQMFPYLRIYAYSIDDNGSLLYAELHKPTDLNANTNKLFVNATAEATPEQLLQLNVITTINSFVTLLAHDEREEFPHYNCDAATKTNFENVLRKEFPWVVPPQGASYDPGSQSGVITLTNAHYDYKKSKYSNNFHDSYDSAYDNPNEQIFEIVTPKKINKLRTNLNSGFEFFNVKSSKDEEQIWNVTVPNSITNWSVEVKSRNDDLSIAPLQKCIKLKVIKKLFLYVTTPNAEYQKGENIPIQVRVSNYWKHEVLAKLSIVEKSDEFELSKTTSDVGEQVNQTVLVAGNNSAGIIFHICSKIVGTITLQVIATSSIGNDTFEINIQVLPAGKFVLMDRSSSLPTFGFNLFEIPNDSKTYVPELPANIVANSQRAVIHIQSDVLQIFFGAAEPARSNSVKTLEHVILTYMKNYLWLKYQQGRARIRGKAEQKLQQTIELNYQEILTYRLKNGSFKLSSDLDVGSIWLTSYVLLCLQDKISADKENITAEALEFLAHQQAQNGSFMDSGKSEIITTLHRNVLTTLVLLVFAKNDKQHKHRSVIQQGLDFLQQQKAEIDERLDSLIGVVREKSGVGYSTRSAEFRRLALDQQCEGIAYECLFYEHALASGLCMVDAILQNYEQDINMSIEVRTTGIDPIKSVLHISKDTSNAFVLETPYGTESVTIKGKGLGVFLVFISYSYHTHSDSTVSHTVRGNE